MAEPEATAAAVLPQAQVPDPEGKPVTHLAIATRDSPEFLLRGIEDMTAEGSHWLPSDFVPGEAHKPEEADCAAAQAACQERLAGMGLLLQAWPGIGEAAEALRQREASLGVTI